MSHTPRDPERIDRMIELLRAAWRLQPDWRLTQLIINATETTHDCSPVYYLDDDAMERRLEALVVGLKKLADSRREP